MFDERKFFFTGLKWGCGFILVALLLGLFSCLAGEAGATNQPPLVTIDESLAGPVPPEFDISALRPASVRFVKWLTLFKNVQFTVSYQHKSLYRADWVPMSAGKVRGAYMFIDTWGTSHIRILLMDPPLVLNNYRGFQPDMFFVDAGGLVPQYDPEFKPLYYRWLSRPELDLAQLIESDELYQRIWLDSLKVLRNADGTFPEEVVEAFGKMGLEKDGFPPHVIPPQDTMEGIARMNELSASYLDKSITYNDLFMPTEWYVFAEDYTVESIHPENFDTHMTIVKETDLDWVVTQLEVAGMYQTVNVSDYLLGDGGEVPEVRLYTAPDYNIALGMDNILVIAIGTPLGIVVAYVLWLIAKGMLRKSEAEKERERERV